jgi:hypothetical protein
MNNISGPNNNNNNNNTDANTDVPSKWIVPFAISALLALIIAAMILPGDVINHGSGSAHKNGEPQYEPARR